MIITRPITRTSPVRRSTPLRLLAVSALLATGLLAACGGGSSKGASQTAAKVNKAEITVHQINFVLQQQRGIKPEQAEAAGRQILERLIDQELAVQKAEDLKLDRDPRVVQALEAARREVLARAYAEKAAEAAVKPTEAEIQQYYDDNPALFSQRRLYSLQEIGIEAPAEMVPELRDRLAGSKNIPEFIEYLKSKELRFAGNQAVRSAEQLPLNMLKTFAAMKEGQALISPAPNGAQVVVLAGARSQPVTLEQARPAIELFIVNDRKRKLLVEDRQALRKVAVVQYVGKYAEGAPPPADDAAASGPLAAPATAPAPAAPAAPASGALDADAINKGLGIKK